MIDYVEIDTGLPIGDGSLPSFDRIESRIRAVIDVIAADSADLEFLLRSWRDGQLRVDQPTLTIRIAVPHDDQLKLPLWHQRKVRSFGQQLALEREEQLLRVSQGIEVNLDVARKTCNILVLGGDPRPALATLERASGVGTRAARRALLRNDQLAFEVTGPAGTAHFAAPSLPYHSAVESGPIAFRITSAMTGSYLVQAHIVDHEFSDLNQRLFTVDLSVAVRDPLDVAILFFVCQQPDALLHANARLVLSNLNLRSGRLLVEALRLDAHAQALMKTLVSRYGEPRCGEPDLPVGPSERRAV